MDESIKHKRGDVREDGKVFWSYSKKYTNGEYWMTRETFEKNKANVAAQRERDKEKNRKKFADYYYKNKDRIAKKKKEQYDADPEKHRELSRKWRENNRDLAVERCKEWHQNNKKHSREYRKQYYQENRDHLLKERALYDKRFPEKRRAKDAYRRAKLKEAIHPEHDRKDDKKLSAIVDIISPEVGNLHIDHIIPLDRDGVHIIYNLRLLPAELNQSKNNKLDSELTPEQQQECYFWRILTRFLTCSYDYANAA